MISSGVVALVLCYAAYSFPKNIKEIVLVGIGWFIFGRSMAEKTVTLVTVPSSSGEPEKIPSGRRWAVQLGMLTFAIGVLTRQWHIAVMGIVYSDLTAAAMWQNFRARLPYLYDPWSEKLPPAPTLMHAMIAISVLVEGGAVVTGMVIAFAGRENIAAAQAIAYAFCALAVSIGTWSFLDQRGVSFDDVCHWPANGISEPAPVAWWGGAGARGLFPALSLGAAGGSAAGFIRARVPDGVAAYPCRCGNHSKVAGRNGQSTRSTNLVWLYGDCGGAVCRGISLSRAAVPGLRSRMGWLARGGRQRCVFRHLSRPAVRGCPSVCWASPMLCCSRKPAAWKPPCSFTWSTTRSFLFIRERLARRFCARPKCCFQASEMCGDIIQFWLAA